MQYNAFKHINKDNREETVPLVRWRWVATFIDGSELMQYDYNTGLFHQFHEIKDTGKQVLSFRMVSKVCPHGIDLLVPIGADLIHYYRVRRLNWNTPQRSEECYFIFGWKINIDGQSFKRMLKIYPNDKIEIIDDDGRGE